MPENAHILKDRERERMARETTRGKAKGRMEVDHTDLQVKEVGKEEEAREVLAKVIPRAKVRARDQCEDASSVEVPIGKPSALRRRRKVARVHGRQEVQAQ